jgi:hypothetical protein
VIAEEIICRYSVLKLKLDSTKPGLASRSPVKLALLYARTGIIARVLVYVGERGSRRRNVD